VPGGRGSAACAPGWRGTARQRSPRPSADSQPSCVGVRFGQRRGGKKQGCGSGLDPDSVTLWIRIRIRIGNPDPDPWARKLRNFSGKNALFSYFSKTFYH
jgi:hypothetical protein